MIDFCTGPDAEEILVDCATVPTTTTLQTQQVTAYNAAHVYAQLGGQP